MKKILPGGIYLLLAIGQALAQPCVPTAPMNAVGGQVFYDENGNGLHDGAELWYPGASLRLYADSDSNGIPDAGALQGATTDGNGRYRFDTLLYYTTSFIYDQRVQAGSDDAYEVRSGFTGDVIETTTAINFGRNHNSNYGAGFRFTGLSLPANAIIDSAFMLIDNALATGNYTTSVNIFGENAASTNAFSDAARIFTRPVTTQSATFGIAWTGGETDVRSPDLSAILQELIK